MTRPRSDADLVDPPRIASPLRVAVLVSGGGSNLQALLDSFSAGDSAVRIALVVGSRAGIGALGRAEAAGVPVQVIDARTLPAAELSARLLEVLDGARIDLVVLAGFMHLVPAAVVERYRGRMINIHPALLPAFGGPGLYGLRVHRAVLESGARVSGVTVHLVDERYDTGPILAQWPVPVLPGDTPEVLAARVLGVEHRLLPEVVEMFAAEPRSAAEPLAAAAFTLVDERALRDAPLRHLVRLPSAADDAAP
jgi:phosphoribosylglycinamide formyltransferase 1